MKLEITEKNIAQLEKDNSAPSVSIYFPLSKSESGRAKDRIRFENMLKEAARKIIAGGSEKSFAREFVEPGFALARDPFFWKTKASGLAFFITSPQILRYFELPAPAKDYLYVGKGFDTSFLRKGLAKIKDYFILAASKKSLALYHAAGDRLQRLSVPGLPVSIADFIPDKSFEKQLQSHGRVPHGKREIMHGHGGKKDLEKTIATKYFTQVDKALRQFLRDKGRPLIFAGDSGNFSLYRRINTYPHLIEGYLAGNFDDTPLPNLFEKAANLYKTTLV
jgi:hypothetical protein